MTHPLVLKSKYKTDYRDYMIAIIVRDSEFSFHFIHPLPKQEFAYETIMSIDCKKEDDLAQLVVAIMNVYRWMRSERRRGNYMINSFKFASDHFKH